MIVISGYEMVNPAHIVRLYKEQDGFDHRKWHVRISTSGGITINPPTFDNEFEADLFMDYVCKEVDIVNGQYKESEDNKEFIEENIN